MGHHYVPQAHLRRFQSESHAEFVWIHDKNGGEPRLAAISKVAQSRAYYSSETERILAVNVEAPANIAIEKLIRTESLTASERLSISNYIATMLKRGPRRRQKADQMYPKVLTETVDQLRKEITALARPGKNSDLIARRLAELDAAEEKFRKKQPSNVTEEIKRPWATKEMLDAIHRMAWRVIHTTGPQKFITSDHPVFFSEGCGLAGKEGELSFPLSSTSVLHGCHQGRAGSLIFFAGTQRLVREINRRIASTTIRFAFCHEKSPWLQPVLAKSSPFLSAIRWEE